MDFRDFENVKHQIGACGAWCGSCVVGNGVLKKLTKKYQEMIDAYGLREWGPKDLDYDEFAKGVRSIQAMPSCPGAGRAEVERTVRSGPAPQPRACENAPSAGQVIIAAIERSLTLCGQERLRLVFYSGKSPQAVMTPLRNG